MIELDTFRRTSYCSNYETRSINVLGPTECNFVPVPINPINIEPSIANDYWPRFFDISDINSNVKCHLVPCILSGFEIEPHGEFKLFCDLMTILI